MPTIIIDLDGTLTVDEASRSYATKRPNLAVLQQLRLFQQQGHRIVIHTARNMRTYEGRLGLINVHTLPVILDWLKQHDVPFDEVVLGKPWCGEGGFYVDDRALRPSEFKRLTPAGVRALLEAERLANEAEPSIADGVA